MSGRAAGLWGVGSAARLIGAGVGAVLFAAGALQAATPTVATRIEIPADFGPAPPAPLELAGSGDGGVSFTTRLGGVLSSFSLERSSTAAGDLTPRLQWSRPIGSSIAGARFTYGGWSVGLAGGTGGEAPGSTLGPSPTVSYRTGWSTGLDYESGPWQIGGYYQFSRSELGGGATHVEQSGYGLGANYRVAPGMRLFSEAYFYNDVASSRGAGNTAPSSGTIKPQSGQLYVIGTHLEW